MLFLLAVCAVSFLVTFLSVPVLIKKFSHAKLTGTDVHKSGKPQIPEMGGLAVVAGMVAGVLLAVALITLSNSKFAVDLGFITSSNLTEVFAALATILIIAIIGMFDDLVRIRHAVKMILPIFASLPLVAVAAGHPYLTLPLIGQLYLPIIYPLILIPLAVTAVSNLTNMLAGFNGLEAGLGIISCLSLGVIALEKGSIEAAVLLLSMSSALIAFIWYNKCPARIFIGDVGTLSIGACIVASIIIGNFEIAGVVIMLPYMADFVIKAKNRMPRELGYIKLEKGKLTASKAVGLPSLMLRATGGLSETNLVAFMLAIETVLGAAVVLLF
jgi:UDP-N-acetylglucosamine--dolichyl-phosphate N-acetylglucosaminephosphotransferase